VVRLVILGAGGHGHDVAAIATEYGHIVEGFLDDDRDVESLGPTSLHVNYEGWLAGVNDPTDRRRLVEDLGGRSPSVWHPSASISTSARWGRGCVVGQNAVIGPSVGLGAHVHVNAGVFITRAVLGDYTTVGPNATICGDVVIGDGCAIGAGAVISNLVTLESGVTIGAGAVVPPARHLGPGTWVGNPATRLEGTVHVVTATMRGRLL